LHPLIDGKQRREKQKFICNLRPLDSSKDRHEPSISIIRTEIAHAVGTETEAREGLSYLLSVM